MQSTQYTCMPKIHLWFYAHAHTYARTHAHTRTHTHTHTHTHTNRMCACYALHSIVARSHTHNIYNYIYMQHYLSNQVSKFIRDRQCYRTEPWKRTSKEVPDLCVGDIQCIH